MSQPGYQRVEIEFHGRPLTVETGRMAKQAGGAALVQFAESVVLVTATALATARGGGRFVSNPTTSQLATSDMNVIVAGSRDAIVMVEGGAQMVPEAVLLDALFTAHEALQPLIALQESLQRLVGKPKRSVTPPAVDPELERQVREAALPSLKAALAKPGKQERYDALDQARDEVVARLGEGTPERAPQVAAIFDHLKKDVVREAIVQQKRRLDGRGLADVRPITCEVEVLPRTHGSALFTRGETQALVVATLGTSSDEQKIDALIGETYKKFMLHYNFPPFSTGEVKFLRSPGRREIGHGALAERALAPILPGEEEFPYTIRIVSEILESNGSSSMATVCGGSLALMDGGVPIKAPVAGVAMGLIKEGGEVRVLSDILGDEDHLGDMDFKVAGAEAGVTAVQMDIKIGGVTRAIMQQALEDARRARLHILGIMNQTLARPRSELSMHAPRIVTIHIKPDRIRDLIGPGGKVIRGITEETGVKIDVEDDGTVLVASSDGEALQKALDKIRGVTAEAEVGKIYRGTVRKIVDFGAFVEIFPGTDGLVHISQLADERVRKVSDVLKEGDVISVKVLEVDKSGKIRLSRKEALKEAEQQEAQR